MTFQLALFIVAFLVVLAVAVKAIKGYIEKVRDELHTDAYEEGWANGYKVGQQLAEKRYDAGWDEGYEEGQRVKKVRKPVKSTKKIAGKE